MVPHIADLQRKSWCSHIFLSRRTLQESSQSYLYNCIFPSLNKEHLFDGVNNMQPVQILCEATEKQAKLILILAKIVAG